MEKVLNEQLIYEILSVVDEIPEGCVATYGQIARLIGREKNARLVGWVLGYADYYGTYPCHRVVSASGRLVPHWTEQKELLLKEHIVFKPNGCVDLKQCQWKI
ncbi:MAG: MGMT family protein [Prevotella sp.]|nr:MGMT family protein [Staphylococcus sp.]MCM1349611.1 MGMT family protein [Prevotella sp.]